MHRQIRLTPELPDMTDFNFRISKENDDKAYNISEFLNDDF